MKHFFIILLIGALLPLSIYSQDQKPDSSKKELTLFDLRIPENEYTSDMQDVRLKKLETHEHMGKITLGLAAVSVLTAVIAQRPELS